MRYRGGGSGGPRYMINNFYTATPINLCKRLLRHTTLFYQGAGKSGESEDENLEKERKLEELDLSCQSL